MNNPQQHPAAPSGQSETEASDSPTRNHVSNQEASLASPWGYGDASRAQELDAKILVPRGLLERLIGAVQDVKASDDESPVYVTLLADIDEAIANGQLRGAGDTGLVTVDDVEIEIGAGPECGIVTIAAGDALIACSVMEALHLAARIAEAASDAIKANAEADARRANAGAVDHVG